MLAPVSANTSSTKKSFKIKLPINPSFKNILFSLLACIPWNQINTHTFSCHPNITFLSLSFDQLMQWTSLENAKILIDAVRGSYNSLSLLPRHRGLFFYVHKCDIEKKVHSISSVMRLRYSQERERSVLPSRGSLLRLDDIAANQWCL